METGSNDQGHQHLTLLPRVKTVGEGGSGTGGDELSVVVQIHPLESEICGDLEPPPSLLAPTSCIFIFEWIASLSPPALVRGFNVNLV